VTEEGAGGHHDVTRDLREATERIEREEFARGHIGPGDRPATPRDAATIVLARPLQTATGGFRVLLLKRPDTARFAAGAFVFAGGTIDPADGSTEIRDRLPPGLGAPETAAFVAGLRELFEETGILLSDEAVDAGMAARARRDLLDGSRSFPELVEALDLGFERLRAVYLSRWVTPARFSRRYDTRFFLAEQAGPAPPAEPVLTDELAGFTWLEPREAVRRFAAGSLPMLFPTRTTLSELAGFGSLDEALAACAGFMVEPLEPRLLVRGDSVRPVLPGDPDYEEAT
jgi:8-oxo-dGTP pyrophosphatase MutT (NUDIX family)